MKKEVHDISLHHASCLTLNIVCVRVLSHVRLFVTPQMGTHPGIEPMSPAGFCIAGGFFTDEPPGKPINKYYSG